MAGETAIALLLGHRKSFDFDIFFTHPISQELLVSINQSFKSRSLHPVVDTKDELSVIVDDQIKITFLFFPFTPLHPSIPLNGIPLYSFEDQASNKAYTICRRAEWKDYVDLYALLNYKHFELTDVIKETKTRFGSNFDEKLFWEQLVYWKDLGDYRLTFIDQPILQTTVETYFMNLAKRTFSAN